MIYILNPDEKIPAHITLKGPFSSQVVAGKNAVSLEGEIAAIVGVGRFPQPQTTVFLRCDAITIKQNWWKPHYGYSPHITIYDGSSSYISDLAYDILKKHRLYGTIKLGRSEIYKSVKGQKTMALRLAVDHAELSEFIGRKLDDTSVRELTISERCAYLDVLTCRLKSVFDSSSY